MKRPMGVVLVALILVILGALGIWLAVDEISALPVAGAIDLILAVAEIGMGIGIWFMQKWAWYGALAIIVLGAVIRIYNLASGGTAGVGFAANLLSLLMFVTMAYYLLKPEVKAAFGR